jgi:hypothetical protein
MMFGQPLTDKLAFGFRLATGAIVGFIVALLSKLGNGFGEHGDDVWRETSAMTLVLGAFVMWAGAGSMRVRTHAIWTAIALAVVGYLIWYALDGQGARNFPFGGQAILIFPFLFIAHELVSSGDQAGRWIAPYETYFDEAWKRGVQLALAILFTALFWGILALGAALLGFIGFKWLGELLTNAYFAWPVTGLAFGTAVHLGDVQTKLLANVRSLILGVLSWLLPVITLIGAIFAVSLLVSGLAPLWATKAATASLLGGCVGFVLLINAAYQQGDEERSVPMVLKWCVRVAAFLLLIFALLAAWSLGLRIGQYGLSADRIFAGLGVIIATTYGVSYSIAAFIPGRWMRALEGFNIALAAMMCALFLALLTPLAAPERLSVNDQVNRLVSGKVSVADFDWWLLKDDTGEYGKKALEALTASPDKAIADKAKAAVANKIGYRPSRYPTSPAETVATRANIEAIQVIFPADGRLPDSFIKMNFADPNLPGFVPSCLRRAPENGGLPSCKIALLDLNNDGKSEVLVREGPSLSIFTQRGGAWVANLDYIDIGSLENDFDAGKLKAAPSIWNDVVIGETRKKLPNFRGSTSSD